MGTNTRNASDKRFVKDCVFDILGDDVFVSSLMEKVASKVEAVLDRKLDQLCVKLQQLEDNNIQLTSKVKDLEEENRRLRDASDSLEQYSRRNSVRFLGIPSVSQGNEEAKVIEVVGGCLDVNIDPMHIDRCHVIGPSKGDKRDILVKFTSYRFKREIMLNKKMLRDRGVSVVDDLSHKRYVLFKNARSAFGVRNVWSFDGTVNCRVDGKKHILRSESDLQKILVTRSVTAATVNNPK